MVVVETGMFLMLLLALLVILQVGLSDKELLLDSQPSSIESGFDKLWHSAYLSSPFFMLAVLFVLFDLELILLLPSISSNLVMLEMSSLFFLISVVLLTLLMEWVFSGLKWHL